MKKINPKPCLICGETYTPTGTAQKYCSNCKIETYKTRFKVYVKRYYQEHPRRKEQTIERWGISVEEYNKLFEDQEGCCAICGKHHSEFKLRLYIDHCHTTNKIRGLLCQQCNVGLGAFKDSVLNLKQAIYYLEKE